MSKVKINCSALQILHIFFSCTAFLFIPAICLKFSISLKNNAFNSIKVYILQVLKWSNLTVTQYVFLWNKTGCYLWVYLKKEVWYLSLFQSGIKSSQNTESETKMRFFKLLFIGLHCNLTEKKVDQICNRFCKS